MTRKKSNVSKIEEKYLSQQNMKKLTANGGASVSKNDGRKAERDMVLDVNQKTDYQQDLLNDITKDIYTSHDNLQNITKEVKGQTETIHNIKKNVAETGVSVKRADKNINVMSRRNTCHKFVLHLLAVILFLGIVACLIFKLVK